MLNETRKGKQILNEKIHVRVGVGRNQFFGDLVQIFHVSGHMLGKVLKENTTSEFIGKYDTVKIISHSCKFWKYNEKNQEYEKII